MYSFVLGFRSGFKPRSGFGLRSLSSRLNYGALAHERCASRFLTEQCNPKIVPALLRSRAGSAARRVDDVTSPA